MKLSTISNLAKKSVTAWMDDFAPSMGAAISYYTAFSIAPLLIIVIAVAGFVFGEDAVRGSIASQISGLVGADGALAIQGLIESASEPTEGLIASSISIVFLIIGATTVFGEIQSALDRIWHVPEADKPSGIWGLLRARFLSFGVVLGLAFLLMVSLVASAAVAAVGGWFGGFLPGVEWLLQAANIVLSLVFMTLLFGMIYKLMPSTSIAWRDVWIGAAVTALLFEIGKVLIGLYLGKAGLDSSYAAAGAIAVVLIWVYYAAQIFLLGAEFTKVYAQEHGSKRFGPQGGPNAPSPVLKAPAQQGNAALAKTPAPELTPSLPRTAPGQATAARRAPAPRSALMPLTPIVRSLAVSSALFIGKKLLLAWLRKRARKQILSKLHANRH